MFRERTLRRLWADAALVFVTLAVFFQVAGFGFLRFDDYNFVCEHPLVKGGLTLDGLHGLLSAAVQGNRVPLTFLSHMVDVQLFGLRPAGHHLVNLLFHLLSVLLLHRLFLALTGARLRSLVVAAVFAVHPLQAEVVAWIAQRRTVLMMFFGLLTLHAYLWYARRPSVGRSMPVAFLFLCGLMSKALLVVLPLLMLLLDYWPLGRLGAPPLGRRLGRLLLEKTPLLALATAIGVGTFVAQRAALTLQLDYRLGFAIKAPHALVSYGWYLMKLFWPANLAVFYPYPLLGEPLPVVLGVGALLAGITLAVFLFGRRVPYLPVGWLWFLVSLLPVIGLVQAGEQAYADRYIYLPMVGMAVVVVWGVTDLVPSRAAGRAFLPAAALLVLTATCAVQVRYWSSEGRLFIHAVEVTGGSHLAHNQLGCLALIYSRTDEAIAHFQAAIRFNPRSIMAHKNLGQAYAIQGRHREAQAEYDLARKMHF